MLKPASSAYQFFVPLFRDWFYILSMLGKRAIEFFLLINIMMLFSCADPLEEEIIDCSVSDISLEVIKIEYADCGLTNGKITVGVNGGTAPFSYSMDNGPAQDSSLFINVGPGFHDLAVRDANGCTSGTRTFMSSKDPFQVVIYSSPSGCQGNKGTITVEPLGGVAPYKYQLGENNDNYQSEGYWENLTSGRHSIWVEDANTCFFGVYATVTSGVKYSEQIAPIIEKNCTSASCHGGSHELDLRSLSTVRANASKIKTVVNDGTMPIDGTLSQEEINLITCWVDDGAPDN
ncbi:MAG: SprB repeat-containing protein [Candidatus Cyclobacteriaceae bacterium M2_1C_046]